MTDATEHNADREPTAEERLYTIVSAHLEAADHEAKHSETIARLEAMAAEVLEEAKWLKV